MTSMSAELFDAVKEEVERFRAGMMDPTVEERESGEAFIENASARLCAVYHLTPEQEDRVRRQLRASYYQICSDAGCAVVPVGSLVSRARERSRSSDEQGDQQRRAGSA